MEQERDAAAVAEVVNIVRIAKEKATILRVMELAIVNSVMVLGWSIAVIAELSPVIVVLAVE